MWAQAQSARACRPAGYGRSDTVTWEKLGLIYEPEYLCSKLISHAANPLAVHIGDDVYRVFFSGRDASKRSSVGYFDFDVVQQEVVGTCDGPAFVHGAAGSFYSHGVSVGGVYEAAGVRYMLFMGWHIPDGGHWRGEIGRLRLDKDLQLSLDPVEPLLGLTDHDPISLSYPFVLPDPEHGYRMWYGSTKSWDGGNGEMVHVLRQATSSDGTNWTRIHRDLPWGLGTAQAFSRPSAIGTVNGYEMWFSYRSGSGQSYRIGNAVTQGGPSNWTLNLDSVGIDVSPAGWDSEMIEYPFVFDHKGARYMLYNGNGFGSSGVGLARFRT